MKDLLTKVIASALVSAVISAGMLYFAFDQSLCGVETALQIQSSAVSETNEWIRSLDGKIDASEKTILDKIDEVGSEISQKIELQGTIDLDQNKNFRNLALELVGLHSSLTVSLVTIHSAALALQATVDKDDPRYEEITRLLTQLESANTELQTYDFSATAQAVDTVGYGRKIHNTFVC
jgi:hypothetical protein